jgi:hypothetical protein
MRLKWKFDNGQAVRGKNRSSLLPHVAEWAKKVIPLEHRSRIFFSVLAAGLLLVLLGHIFRLPRPLDRGSAAKTPEYQHHGDDD